MDLNDVLLCHKGAVIFVPRPEECSVPVEEWPRPLQILLGLVEGPWKEPERNEEGQLLFAHNMKISSHHMAAIFAFLRKGIPPITNERICVAEEAFTRFGGCNVFDQAVSDWLGQDKTYNPRFPENDVDNLYDWDIATPYMMRDKLDTWELVSLPQGASEFGIWRSLKEQ